LTKCLDRTSTEIPAKPKKTIKRRQRATESDDEADGASSDYMPPSRKRAKVAPVKSAPKTSRKKKPAQVVQFEDSDDDGAIVITVKKKGKADSGIASSFLGLVLFIIEPRIAAQASMASKKSGLSSSNCPVSTKDEDRSSKSRSRSCQASKAQKQLKLYMDEEEEEEAEGVSGKPERTARNVRNSKATSKSAYVKMVDGDATLKSKPPVVLTKPSKVVASPDSESDDSDSNKAPLKGAAKAVKPTRTTTASKTGHQPQTRQHDMADGEQSALPPPTCKRAKAVQPPESDETLIGSAESKDVIRRAEKITT
jgi:hypothetical protein